MLFSHLQDSLFFDHEEEKSQRIDLQELHSRAALQFNVKETQLYSHQHNRSRPPHEYACEYKLGTRITHNPLFHNNSKAPIQTQEDTEH